MLVSPDHLLTAAQERFAAHDYFGTVHHLEELVEAGHAYADAHHLMGVALAMLGRSDGALAAFERALALNPRYVEALVHRGLVLNELGRSDEGMESFREAMEVVPPSRGGFPAPVAAGLSRRHAELAEAYAEAGALREAVAQYRRALELGPTFHDYRYRLARLLIEAGLPLDAREELERLLEARPGGRTDVHAALGLAHFLAGDAVRAREIWRDALEREPENTRVEAYLAMVERAGG